jgi:hypothetical protein
MEWEGGAGCGGGRGGGVFLSRLRQKFLLLQQIHVKRYLQLVTHILVTCVTSLVTLAPHLRREEEEEVKEMNSQLMLNMCHVSYNDIHESVSYNDLHESYLL